MLLLTYFSIAIGISFLCSVLEAVMLSITPTFIEVTKERNIKTGKLLQKLKDNMDLSIGAILTLNTFAHTLGAAGVGAEAAKIFGQEYMFYISAVLTILILIFSEIIPKTIGAYYWKGLSGISIRIVNILVFVLYPLLKVMQKITDIITPKEKNSTAITKEEIVATAAMGEEAGILKSKQSSIIENLLKLNQIKTYNVHTPRNVMFAISTSQLEEFLEHGKCKGIDNNKFKEYSRIPIYEEDIDDIVGIVFSKELFHQYIFNSKQTNHDLIRPAFQVNENIPISKLLDLFLAKKEHLFVVVDNYYQTEGIVTLEDVLESLLGEEIVDELDKTIDLRELAKQVKNTK